MALIRLPLLAVASAVASRRRSGIARSPCSFTHSSFSSAT